MSIDHKTTGTSTDTDDEEFVWALEHNRQVAREASRSPWSDILDEHGSMEAWQEDCQERRDADTDLKLARIIITLMADTRYRPRGTLREPDRVRLLADASLAAYWSSVADAGESAWSEEGFRIKRRQREAMAEFRPERRMFALSDYAIKDLLPIFRLWGSILIQEGLANDLADAFRIPGSPGIAH